MSTLAVTQSALVFHPGGALGDFVLMWPMIRALRARGTVVEVISAGSRIRLVGRILGVGGSDFQHPHWTSMWRGPLESSPAPRDDVGLVVGAGVNETWIEAARQRFPSATIVSQQGWMDRRGALSLQRRVGPEAPVPRHAPAANPSEVVCHVGTGGGGKAWPLARWLDVRARLANLGLRVRLVAGEVEEERWAREERDAFERHGGQMLGSLDQLVDVIAPAAAFVGADTGPTHLAAQLALPTLALFGPTDPGAWAPIGPCTRLLAPRQPAAMAWLTSEVVLRVILEMLQEATAPLLPEPPRRQ